MISESGRKPSLRTKAKRLFANSTLLGGFPPKSLVQSTKGVDWIPHRKVRFDRRGTWFFVGGYFRVGSGLRPKVFGININGSPQG
jgi:hypothetical protein